MYVWITGRILGYMICSRHHGTQAFCIMAFMMTMGISLRVFHLVPDIFIAVFYSGLGASLLCAGLLFLVQFYFNVKEKNRCRQ